MASKTPTLARFGKYELTARLARGGMAETFRAQLKGAAGVTKQVVIKKVLPHLAQDEAFITAFINEAKLSASLSHGNIAQVFDFGRVEGDYFIAMELVDGRSLAQMLERAGTMGFAKVPIPIACFIAIEVLKGLQYAHTRVGDGGQPLNLVHRDISPENVLVSFEGQTKVVDFGVAKAAMRGRTETEPGLVKGKYLFFSPEQACAEVLDGRSDVFAVGIVLYRMLCGVLPFTGQMHNVMRDIVAGRFKPAGVVNPALPSALVAVLARAMATEPAERFSTALEMQEAVASFLYRQEPTFSDETVKEWMTWLFKTELEAEGRSKKLSARFHEQLQTWDPQGQATGPSLQGVTREERPHVARMSRKLLAAMFGGFALVAAGLTVGVLTSADPEPARVRAPVAVAVPVPVPVPPEPMPLSDPFPDELVFPGTITVLGHRHRLRFEQASLPVMTNEGLALTREVAAPLGHSALFAIGRSNQAVADGKVVLVSRLGLSDRGPFSALKVFDFQPFRPSLRGDVRSLSFGSPAPNQSFSDTEAQIDSRAGAWVRIVDVNGETAKLTLRAIEPRTWAVRPRPSSVVVAWQRVPGYRSSDDSAWLGGLDRAVLTEGTALLVQGATAFAIAFADSFATTARDSVEVKVERAGAEELRPPASPVAEVLPADQRRVDSSLDLAKRLFKDKQYPAARVTLEKCIRLAPRNADCHKLLGTVWAKLNEPRKGSEAYRKFLMYAPPDHPDFDKVSKILEAFEQQK